MNAISFSEWKSSGLNNPQKKAADSITNKINTCFGPQPASLITFSETDSNNNVIISLLRHKHIIMIFHLLFLFFNAL